MVGASFPAVKPMVTLRDDISSYNMVNETHSCSNAYTQNNLLKGEVRACVLGRCIILIMSLLAQFPRRYRLGLGATSMA